jgi:hypothetical protein
MCFHHRRRSSSHPPPAKCSLSDPRSLKIVHPVVAFSVKRINCCRCLQLAVHSVLVSIRCAFIRIRSGGGYVVYSFSPACCLDDLVSLRSWVSWGFWFLAILGFWGFWLPCVLGLLGIVVSLRSWGSWGSCVLSGDSGFLAFLCCANTPSEG